MQDLDLFCLYIFGVLSDGSEVTSNLQYKKKACIKFDLEPTGIRKHVPHVNV